MAETPPAPPSDATPGDQPAATGDAFVYTDEDGVEHEMALVEAAPLDDEDWSDGDDAGNIYSCLLNR